MKNNVQAIILGAGKSSRFNSNKTKLAEPICGQPMILFTTKLLAHLAIETTVVVGHEKEVVENIISNEHGDAITFIAQEQQLGTGHALACTEKHWTKDNILIINGDMPLVTEHIITNLYTQHTEKNATISFVTTCNPEPTGKAYGRVVTTENNIAIVEAKDFTGNPQEHCCINAGIYLIKKDFLQNYITELKSNNASNEFYITDLIAIASNNGKNVTTISAPFDTIRGINTLQELWAAEQIKRSELINHWMDNGVRFSLAQNVHIDLNVTIGQGTFIECGVHLRGITAIGKNCHIYEFSSLENATLEDNVTVYSHSVINNSHIQSDTKVGPFAHVHKNSILGKSTTIGNFVEVKNCTLGAHTKAKHLTYLGDATIGSCVNIGAGTITCNYNGVTKERTTIKNNAFIGSNNSLVAPVTVGENAFTAAGSTITTDVPDNALAIARAQQTNKPNYAHTLLKNTNQSISTPPISTTAHSGFSFVGARLVNHDIPADEQ
jgi:bifunctional UDP-N-acetylglucosamine pyrophosphorylase/glucosamine-1-phosphate N-acetyltransferase